MKRIGFFPRLLAALIDVALWVILCFGVGTALAAIEFSPNSAAPVFLMLLLAYSLTEIFCAGTPGKLLLRQRIASANETPADGWRLFLRWSTKQSPLIFLSFFLLTGWDGFRLLYGLCALIVLIGCLYSMNDDKLAWHDQWAGTAVYRKPARSVRGIPTLNSNK